MPTSLPIAKHQKPPSYCQCSGAACDQSFDHIGAAKGIFLYPSNPPIIANTIEGAVAVLRHNDSKVTWRTWKDFRVAGQFIFCEICRRMRFGETIFADVTTLNLNLLFEIGYALGLDIPVVPIRDATYIKNKIEFEELGLIDTLGYLDFANAAELASKVSAGFPFRNFAAPAAAVNLQQPLYVVKGPLETEGEVRLMSLLKKSSLRFRVFDIRETPRLSLHEARRQIASSLGFVAHLLDRNRHGAAVHNARCALLAGIATASGKVVLLLQEGDNTQPIDYRDLVVSYQNPAKLERLIEPFVRTVVGLLQDSENTPFATRDGYLARLNLGDVAAENEIVALRSYFVRTAQYHQAKRGPARLVTGRKGAGKTAIFYAVRHSIPDTNSHLVLDLKPEGYQFTKLREAVLDELSLGLQEHTMAAFWEYILLCEMAQKIIDKDYSWAQREEERRRLFDGIRRVYERQPSADVGDFSERLLRQVDSLVERFENEGITEATSGQFTAALFKNEIRELEAVIVPYLLEKEGVWILVDNLDKGWPTRGAAPADVLIIRALLDATRKLQRQLEQRGLELHVLVFLRNDIYDLLVRQTSDRGKDTQIALEWNDPELFKEMVLKRILRSMPGEGQFDEVWRRVFEPNVGVQDSFSYMLDRTLMRPRDLLNFIHRVLETAVNRGHERATEDDIRTAEKFYSEDILLAMTFELRDIYADYGHLPYVFVHQPSILSSDQVRALLAAEVSEERIDSVIEMLVWFGFLGTTDAEHHDPEFAYQVRYNVDKLLATIRRGTGLFVVHPAFRRALAA